MTRTTMDETAHAREEGYFRGRDAETPDRRRAREQRHAETRALAAAANVSDEVAISLVSLGFDAETYRALYLLPAVWTAWAEGVLSGRERDCVVALAEESGMGPYDPAFEVVLEWLEWKPSETYFVHGLAGLAAILRAMPLDERADVGAEVLLGCGEVARASGGVIGFFGLGSRVSDEEHEVIGRIREIVAGALEAVEAGRAAQ